MQVIEPGVGEIRPAISNIVNLYQRDGKTLAKYETHAHEWPEAILFLQQTHPTRGPVLAVINGGKK